MWRPADVVAAALLVAVSAGVLWGTLVAVQSGPEKEPPFENPFDNPLDQDAIREIVIGNTLVYAPTKKNKGQAYAYFDPNGNMEWTRDDEHWVRPWQILHDARGDRLCWEWRDERLRCSWFERAPDGQTLNATNSRRRTALQVTLLPGRQMPE